MHSNLSLIRAIVKKKRFYQILDVVENISIKFHPGKNTKIAPSSARLQMYPIND
jgi:hypothetical protein